MNEKERDILDDLFRSKLENFEVDTVPGDWEAIADRLPNKTSIPFRRTIRYWAAAAVISLLMVTGGVYIFNNKPLEAPVAAEVKEQIKVVESRIIEQNKAIAEVPELSATQVDKTKKKANVAVVRPLQKTVLADAVTVRDIEAESVVKADEAEIAPLSMEEKRNEVEEEFSASSQPETTSRKQVLVADAAPVKTKKQPATRKWGIGLGGGGFSVGSESSVPQYMLKSASLSGDKLMSLNSPFFNEELPKTDVHHKTPVSFGIGVSRYLNNRFSLQTGINYSYLSSDWVTNGTAYHGKVKQKLHFIGIPLSVAYKIAEWKRFQVYAAAGGMAEVNVTGKQETKFFMDATEVSRDVEHVRMKEWLWSVNARAGISYPIIRFVSAFAEVGAAYYFDNGSDIETIHSEKPFNVNLQFGFRLGF